MQELTRDQLAATTGGNDLTSWLPTSAGDFHSPDMTATSQPSSPSFQHNTPMVSGGPDRSWEQTLPGAFSALGI